MRRLLLSFLAVAVLGAGSAWAQNETPGTSHAVATVTLTQQVLAGGQPLAPGTYEIRISDERPNVGAGAPSAMQRAVEFVRDGKVVAKEIAEVFPRTERDVAGTSGSTAAGKARVETLRGGEFVRVSVSDSANRYLVHLPTGPLAGPTPTPQPPARIELPPKTTTIPQ